MKKMKSKGNMTNQIREKLAVGFDLPHEVISNLPVIKLIGNKEISIENFTNLIEYNPQKIRLSTHSGMLIIDGIGLEARSMTAELIVIKGMIIQIAFAI